MEATERELLRQQLVRVGSRIDVLAGIGSDVWTRVLDVIFPVLTELIDRRETTTDEEIEVQVMRLRDLVGVLEGSPHPIANQTARAIKDITTVLWPKLAIDP